jgi:catechol 2,3-dioxygenase-like lactoylglutathione lyase family enzyme
MTNADERHGLGRRGVLLGLTASALVPGSGRAAEAVGYPFRYRLGVNSDGPIEVVGVNSVTLHVSDLRRSLDFYQHLYGLPIQARQGKAVCLRVGDGPSFIRLVQSDRPGFERPCLAIKDFDPEKVKATLTRLGVESEIRYRTEAEGGGGKGARRGTPELFLRDLDGTEYQLQHPAYAGGAGALGEITALEALPPSITPVMQVSSLHHVGITYRDLVKAVEWLQMVFRVSVVALQGWPGYPTIGVGQKAVLGVGGNGGPTPLPPGARLGANHFSVGVKDWDPEVAMQKLIDFGLEPVPNGPDGGPPRPLTCRASIRTWNRYGGGPGAAVGTVEAVNVYDPDTLQNHSNDVDYCTGWGRRGEHCPPVGSTEVTYQPEGWRPWAPSYAREPSGP